MIVMGEERSEAKEERGEEEMRGEEGGEKERGREERKEEEARREMITQVLGVRRVITQCVINDDGRRREERSKAREKRGVWESGE